MERARRTDLGDLAVRDQQVVVAVSPARGSISHRSRGISGWPASRRASRAHARSEARLGAEFMPAPHRRAGAGDSGVASVTGSFAPREAEEDAIRTTHGRTRDLFVISACGDRSPRRETRHRGSQAPGASAAGRAHGGAIDLVAGGVLAQRGDEGAVHPLACIRARRPRRRRRSRPASSGTRSRAPPPRAGSGSAARRR